MTEIPIRVGLGGVELVHQLKPHVIVTTPNIVDFHIEVRGITRALQDDNASEGGMFSPPLNMLESVCAYGDELERDGVSSVQSKITDKEPVVFSGARWYGVDSRYFMNSISMTKPASCAQSVEEKSLRLNRPLPMGFSALSTEAVLYSDFVASQSEIQSELTFYRNLQCVFFPV